MKPTIRSFVIGVALIPAASAGVILTNAVFATSYDNSSFGDPFAGGSSKGQITLQGPNINLNLSGPGNVPQSTLQYRVNCQHGALTTGPPPNALGTCSYDFSQSFSSNISGLTYNGNVYGSVRLSVNLIGDAVVAPETCTLGVNLICTSTARVPMSFTGSFRIDRTSDNLPPLFDTFAGVGVASFSFRSDDESNVGLPGIDVSSTITYTTVPEPALSVLVAAGLAAMLSRRIYRTRRGTKHLVIG